MSSVLSAFLVSCGFIFAAELGDKSQLMALTFATRYPVTLKTGLKQANFKQKQLRDLAYYTYAGKPTTPENGGITPYLGYNMLVSEGKYGPFPFVQLAETGNPGDPFANRANWTQTPVDVWNTVYQSLANDAAFENTVNAAYVMGDARFGRLRVLTGLRWEETRSSGSNYLRVSNTTNNVQASLSPEVNAARARDNFRKWTTQGTKYDHVFPGLHFVYQLTPNTQVRSSYNATITRPSPTNLLPAIVPNELSQTLSAGNPALKPYTSDNYELSFSHFLGGIGQISAGGFYKDISNYFRSIRSVVPEGANNGFAGDYAGWQITRNENVGSAWIKGLEFNYTQQYTSLPGIWRGLGLFANYTYLDTYGDYGSGGYYSVSDTAEYGDYTRGPRVITDATRAEMKKILTEIQTGQFAREWMAENREGGRKKFLAMRASQENQQIETVGAELRKMMTFLKKKKEAGVA